MELGEALRLVRSEPGHYATAVKYDQFSSCSRSYSSYSAQASLVLDLEPGGEALACRGKQSRQVGGSRGSGAPSDVMDVREQQGYRGRWQRDGAWTEVKLELDSAVCPQQRGFTNIEPKPWHLRCLSVEPNQHPLLPRPALICQFAEPVYSEGLGYQATGALPGEWILLGRGNGLRVTWNDGMMGQRPEISIVAAEQPIAHDAWLAAWSVQAP